MANCTAGPYFKCVNLVGPLGATFSVVAPAWNAKLTHTFIAYCLKIGRMSVQLMDAGNLKKDINDGLSLKPTYGSASDVMETFYDTRNGSKK